MHNKESNKAKQFRENIYSHNALFAFTSMGGKVDKTINQCVSPCIYRLHGQNFHYIGSLLPIEGKSPQYA